MAQRFEVFARLAEGRAAVQHTDTYVTACQLRGFQHPDLTAYPGQVRDWYDGEDGLDLRLLDGDCAQLRAVADAAAEALRVQRAQLGELAAAWHGPGADEAAGFLHRHCESAAVLAAGLATAAEACGALRDELWRVIDAKVSAAVDIDERAGAQRVAWLTAAHTVTAGGQQPAADELIDQQVKPYVDNDIRVDWLAAMQSARTAVAAAYDAATSAAAPGPGAVFSIPGELGPGYPRDDPVPPAPVVPVVAAAAAPAQPDPTASPTAPPPDDPVPAPPGETWPSAADLPAGGGLPTGGASLGGLIPRIADAIGSLLGSPGDDPTAAELDDPIDEAPDAEEAEADSESDEPDEPAEPDEPEPAAAEPEPDGLGDAAPAADAAAAPVDQPIAVPATQEPELAGTDETPCEIAADDLPQAGQ